jgi:hypothetical protein
MSLLLLKLQYLHMRNEILISAQDIKLDFVFGCDLF